MAKKNFTKIRQLLKDKNNYDIETLSQKLKLKEHETKELLLQFLYSELSCIDIVSEHKRHKFVYKIFNYFNKVDYKKEYEMVLSNLEKCSRLCKKRMYKLRREFGVDSIFLHKILDKINATMIGINYSLNIDEKDVNEVSYDLLNYVITNLRNYNYLQELLKTFPEKLTVKNNNGEYLIEVLVDRYINLVKSNKSHADIIYYEKVIKLFTTNSKFFLESNLEKKLIFKLKQVLIDNRDSVGYDNKKIFFFINEIINDIEKKSENVDYESDLEKTNYKYEIDASFAKNILEETKKEVDIYTGALDCTDKYTITVDNENTWVYDDACSLEILPNNGHYLLGIYVADVTRHVKRGEQIDKEALKRSETVYVPFEPITMLPVELTKRLSLSQGNDKGVIGLFMEIDKNLRIVNVSINRCIINVKKNYTYEEVDSILQSSSNIGIYKKIKDMYQISTNIKDVTNQGKQYRELKKIRTSILMQSDVPFDQTINPSCNMIAQFMMQANMIVANYFASHSEIPFIFRINLAGYSADVIDKIKEISKENMSFEELRRYINYILPPSIYSSVNFGHNGLNLKAYCHFTNPLRNYSSLEVQRIVVENMIGENIGERKDKKYYDDICKYMNSRIELDQDYVDDVKQLYKRYNVVDKK